MFETPHDAPPTRLFMITAYLDESHHSDVQQYSFVAGFWGKKDHWDALALKWPEALGKRKVLHLSELRWNDSKSERRVRDLLAKLGPIPYECGVVPVWAGVRTKDYLDLIANDSRCMESISGYVICLAHILLKLCTSLPAYERIKVVCEVQTKYEPFARSLFSAFQITAQRERVWPQLKSIEFVRKNSTILLQPADYLAYALGHFFNENGGKRDLWCRPIHPDKYVPSEKWRSLGAWLPRNVARETILLVKDAARNKDATIHL